MKALKKALVALLGAVLGCCFFVGCLSTKLSVTYVVDGETYRVQELHLPVYHHLCATVEQAMFGEGKA